jgi:hypothetical protein
MTWIFRLRCHSVPLGTRCLERAHATTSRTIYRSERRISDPEGFMLRREIALGAIAALLVGCTADKPAPTALEIHAPLFAVGGNSAFNLGTHMTGAEEVFTPVPPSTATPADSKGQGEAIFRVSGDGTSVDFRLIASNIDNVIMSHIHCGRPGQNGPIRMWLYPVIGPTGAPGPNGTGPQNGVLATGTFNPTGVICPASAVGQDMPLLDAIRAGLTYVNVHTNEASMGSTRGQEIFPEGRFAGSSITDDRRKLNGIRETKN